MAQWGWRRGLPAAGRGPSGGAARGRRGEQDGCSRLSLPSPPPDGPRVWPAEAGGGAASGLPVQLRDTRSPAAGARSAWGRRVTSASARRRGSAGVSQGGGNGQRAGAGSRSNAPFSPRCCSSFARPPGLPQEHLQPAARPRARTQARPRAAWEGSVKAEGLCSQPGSCKDGSLFFVLTEGGMHTGTASMGSSVAGP